MEKASFKKVIQKFWTENVPGYDVGIKQHNACDINFFINVDNERYCNDEYIPSLVQSLAVSGKKVLEVGCGLGADTRLFSKLGAYITSMDLSKNNAFLTKKGLGLLDLNGNVACGDAENIPFKNNSFDIVYSFGVLHHTPKTQEAINELHRVLKPGGRCLIMLYHKGYQYYYIHLVHGILGFKRLFYSEEQILSKKYDKTPLSKMYSKKDAALLFSRFKEIDFEVLTYGGNKKSLRFTWIYLLFKWFPVLLKNFGSFLIIRASK